MSTFLSSTIRTARKEYKCDACRAAIEPGLKHFLGILTFSERKLIALARRDNWRIKAGNKYVDYRGVCDSSAYTLRMRPEIQNLVSKYNWWPEE